MPLDSNGIWQYVESDVASPFSTLLNRLASSVSAKIGTYLDDTGWLNLGITSGWSAVSGNVPQFRRIGDMVWVRGRFETTSGTNVSGTVSPGFFPDTTAGNSCDPPVRMDFAGFSSAGTTGPYRLSVLTSGTITATGLPSTNTIDLGNVHYLK